MVQRLKSIDAVALRMIVGLALLLDAPLLAAPPAPAPHPTMVLQAGPSGGIDTLAYSPDGKTLATGGDDGVRLWDTASGQVETILTGASGPLFSPDRKTLATAGGGGVKLWDVTSGQLKVTLPDAVGPLAFSPDGKTLATGDGGLWDVASGQLMATLKDAGLPLAFSPDSKTLATTDASQAQLWDVASRQLKATLKGKTSQLAFSTDGKTLATRDGSSHLRLWDVASASPITITAQTSLAQFPPWLTYPFFWDQSGTSPLVSLLDPVDEHVLATLQALPDAPAAIAGPPPDPAAAPPTGGNWITTTPDGYFEGSMNLQPFVRWNVDGVLYPAAAYWDLYYRPDLVQQALKIAGE